MSNPKKNKSDLAFRISVAIATSAVIILIVLMGLEIGFFDIPAIIGCIIFAIFIAYGIIRY